MLRQIAMQGQRPRGIVVDTKVDTKAIGRPEKLGGTLEEASRSWRRWNYRLELWLASQFPEAPETGDILTWARTQDEEITIAALRAQTVTGVTPERCRSLIRQLEVLDPTDMVTSFRWLRAFMSMETVPDLGGLDPGY